MCATTGLPFHSLLSFSATVFMPGWFPPLSPIRMMLWKPRILIVPAVSMWLVFGSMDPSGTSGIIGAIPQLASDRVAVGPEHVVVFAEREPRAVRLDAACRNDDCRPARFQRVA